MLPMAVVSMRSEHIHDVVSVSFSSVWAVFFIASSCITRPLPIVLRTRRTAAGEAMSTSHSIFRSTSLATLPDSKRLSAA